MESALQPLHNFKRRRYSSTTDKLHNRDTT